MVKELVGAVLTRPSLDASAAALILRREWGLVGELRDLPSERDRNFAVVMDGVARFVLKISNANESLAFLDLQHRAMDRLVRAGLPCQQAIRTTKDAEIVDVGTPASPHFARLLTWLPGRPLAGIPADGRTTELLEDHGRTMGRTASAHAGFDHPAAHRSFQWSAEEGADVIRAHAPAIRDPHRLVLIERWLVRLAPLEATFAELRHGVIHNDANDHNVLVGDDGATVTGLLDLGDSIWSVLVNELAVAAAYACLDARDPVAVIEVVRRGFESALPLTDVERAALPELVALRLATSVALSAHQSALAPDDPYLTVSEAPAWVVLERLIDEAAP